MFGHQTQDPARRRMALALALAGGVAVLAMLAGCDKGSAPTASQTRSPAATSAAASSSPSATASPTATASATAVSGVPAPASPAPAAVVKPLPTDRAVQRSGSAIAASWRLAFSGGCFYLASPVGGEKTAVVWPSGYTAKVGPLGVYDAHGQLVGRPGDTMSLTADAVSLSSVPSGAVAHPGCLGDAKTALFVS